MSRPSPAAPRTATFVGPRTASFLYTVTAVAIALIVLAPLRRSGDLQPAVCRDGRVEVSPGYDDAIRSLDQHEALSLLETRFYQFRCGCSLERLFPTFASLDAEALAELYQEDEVLQIQCPRCGARYAMSRESLEAYLSS